MTIAIIGAGAIGSVLAAYLTKANIDVILVGRKDHVDVINKNGLKVCGLGEGEVFSVKAVTQLKEVCELAIFTTKAQDIESVYQDNHEFLEECDVLSVQNGVQADSMLGFHFERDKQYSSIITFGATYCEPGVVSYDYTGDWIVGKPAGMLNQQTHKITEVLSSAFNVVAKSDILHMKWFKLFLDFDYVIPALINKSLQETYSDLDLCRLSIAILKEGFEVVEKAGLTLESLPNFPKERISELLDIPIDKAVMSVKNNLTTLSKVSLYGEVLKSLRRCKKSEIEFINGEVVFLAKQMRFNAPLNEKILDMVNYVESSNNFYTIELVKKEFDLVVV
ncbi:MAG: 2-dehydropantoate 2-reductase [Lysobacterales bacterium]|jgi:2-dehydropantoate 2-reductase